MRTFSISRLLIATKTAYSVAIDKPQRQKKKDGGGDLIAIKNYLYSESVPNLNQMPRMKGFLSE